MTSPAVVLYPGAGGIGHIAPMVELAKAILNHGYDVTMVLINEPSDFGDTSVVARRIAACNPSISVHILPTPAPLPDLAASSGKVIITNPFVRMLDLMRRYNAELERFLLRSAPRCLLADVFCVDAIDVAAKLSLPAYTFFPSCASALAVLIQVPALIAGRRTGLKELGDAPLEFAGVPPVPASHLIKGMLEHPDDPRCKALVDVWTRCTGSRGVLVNTFEALESRAVAALRDPRGVGPGRPALPPVYCVGPLVADGAMEKRNDADECLAWLDAQPERSVVFLCFGSRGTHSAEQIKEIAAGLENSGHRFLWVVRAPPAAGDDPHITRPPSSEQQRHDPDLVTLLLPEGFVERTKARGLVVESWAPQPAVLRHPATAAFVTHCGWNSTLESVVAGVPMLCWPMHAEQKMNKVFVVAEDMGVGVEMEGCVTTGFVCAGVVEAKVRMVMESEEGRRLRTRAVALKEEARAAVEDGGSSRAAFARFLSHLEESWDRHRQIAE